MAKRDHSTSHKSTGRPDDGYEAELIFVERQFPIVMRIPLIAGMFLILVGLVPWSFATANAYSWQPLTINWLIIWSAILLSYWIYHFVGWYFTVLILTSEEVTLIKQKGFFKRSVQSLTLNNVQSVNYTIPGMQGAMFHFGDLRIETLSGSGHMSVKTMFKPALLQAEILEAIQDYSSTDKDSIVYDTTDSEFRNK
ncbi:MAG: PH domain-containing protein [Candidatus Saccharibacteria bacterium]